MQLTLVFHILGSMGGRNDLDWDMEEMDCECPGSSPPPAFRLPPPPRPPFLHEIADCAEPPMLDLETCNAVPVIDAEFHSSPALPPLAVIIVCALLLLAIILIATALVWKHKKKMQNFLPCKSSPQNHCDVAHGNGVIYEDLTNIRPRPLPQPSMEMLDVKARGIEMAYHSPVFICPPAPPHSRPLPSHQYCSQDLYNPVYEELSNGSGDRGDSEGESDLEGRASEDEFAEDELSVGGPERGGGGGGVSCRNKGAEFHEGLLLDALLRPPPHRLPYILPVPPPPGHYEPVHRYGPPPRPEFTTFRPAGHDSDSGYSQDTSGGRRRTPHRLPHATDLVIS